MTTWRLTIAYHGAKFCGYQRQPVDRTVEAELRKAVKILAHGEFRMRAAGRTDAGVHALGQVVSATFDSSVTERKMPLALCALLPKDVSCVKAEIVDESFDAKYSCIGKQYLYKIDSRHHRDPFEDDRAWQLRGSLDIDAMSQAAKYFEGEHDYESFRSARCDAEHARRSIWRVAVLKDPQRQERTLIDVRGNAFCRNMVRIIVGTLVDVGKHRLDPEKIPEILVAKDREQAGMTAPAQGLYMAEVYYRHNVEAAEIPEGTVFPGWPLSKEVR